MARQGNKLLLDLWGHSAENASPLDAALVACTVSSRLLATGRCCWVTPVPLYRLCCVEFSSVSTKKRTWLSHHLLQGMMNVTDRRLNPRPPKFLTALLYTTVGTLCKNSNEEFDKTPPYLWLLQISLPVVGCYMHVLCMRCTSRYVSQRMLWTLYITGKRLHAASMIITVKSGISQFNLAKQRLCTLR